jgi:hypothetical protein
VWLKNNVAAWATPLTWSFSDGTFFTIAHNHHHALNWLPSRFIEDPFVQFSFVTKAFKRELLQGI